MTYLYIAAALITGIIYPGFAIYSGRNTFNWLQSEPDKKMVVLIQSAIFLIALLLLTLVPFVLNRQDLSVIGLGFIKNPVAVLSLFGTCLVLLWLLNLIKLTPESATKIIQNNTRLLPLLPANRKEYQVMVFVSFIAGISEEIIYRGFLFWYLSQHLSIIPAVVLANLPFALAHLTSTGMKNSFFAFLLALLFTGFFLLTKSLWLSIFMHIMIDLYSTVLTYKASQTLRNSYDDFTTENENEKT